MPGSREVLWNSRDSDLHHDDGQGLSIKIDFIDTFLFMPNLHYLLRIPVHTAVAGD